MKAQIARQIFSVSYSFSRFNKFNRINVVYWWQFLFEITLNDGAAETKQNENTKSLLVGVVRKKEKANHPVTRW